MQKVLFRRVRDVPRLRHLSFFFFGAVALLFCRCDEGESKKLVKVGSSVLRQSDMEAFSGVCRNYPVTPPEFALAERSPVTAFIECASIYKKERFRPAHLKYRFSRDWRWKKRYLLAVNFMAEVLQQHLGYTEKELRKYYDGHRSEFLSPTVHDSSGVICTTMVTIPYTADLKRQIAERLFVRDYRPDSAFLATVRLPPGDDNAISGRWIKYMRYEGYQEVFLERFYKEKYGTSCPVSFDALVGDGKILSRKDVDILLSWMSGRRREMLGSNPQSMNNVARLLSRWLLFSDRAKTSGYASQPKIKAMLKWLWRFELAQRTIRNSIGPAAKSEAFIDSSLAIYSYWDETGAPGPVVDTVKRNEYFGTLFDLQVKEHFNARLDKIRRDAKVTILARDWDDRKNSDPESLLHRADSLHDVGSAAEAQRVYRILANEFGFSVQGKKAFVALAKLQTDKKLYRDAIRWYRRALAADTDPALRCNCMFMTGFIYDEYLNRPDMAEINYKWVLRNTPDCEEADETEFMMLHLDEPESSPEELQAEAMRQGRPVENSAIDATPIQVESERIDTASD